jgi:hypothetical protein
MPLAPSPSPRPPRGSLPLLGLPLLAGLLVALAGCEGSAAPNARMADLAQRGLPRVNTMPYPPDSLTRVRIRETEDGRLRIESEIPYLDLQEDWSVTWRTQRGVRQRGQQILLRTFATLWSRDLSIAALEAEGASVVTADVGRRMLERRRTEIDSLIQIDVYRFEGSPFGRGINPLSLAGPDADVRLRDDSGNEIRPVTEQKEQPEQVFARTLTVNYQRNIFLFPRHVDGRDWLTETSQLELFVRQTNSTVAYTFTWTAPDA